MDSIGFSTVPLGDRDTIGGETEAEGEGEGETRAEGVIDGGELICSIIPMQAARFPAFTITESSRE